jgi:hypothetical protein
MKPPEKRLAPALVGNQSAEAKRNGVRTMTTKAILPDRENCTILLVAPPPADELRLARFRRKLRDLRRDTLLRNIDLFLEQADEAEARGDHKAHAWAMARWNAVWDVLDARDGLSVGASK